MSHPKKLRILYLTGPADIVGDYHAWKNPSVAPTFGGGVFMEQFFQYCEVVDAGDVLLISTASGKDAVIGRFSLEYRNPNTGKLSGARYHLRMVRYMTGILKEVVAFKPDVFIIGVADAYWFTLSATSFLQFRLVPFFHCTLWPRLKSFDDLTFVQRTLLRLTGLYLRANCKAVLSITDVIEEQMARITGPRGPKVVPFRPIYDAKLFADIRPPDRTKPVFRVMFVGRVTRDKGIYTLLNIARKLKREPVAFDICGAGEVQELNDIAKGEGLALTAHGVCDRSTLKTLYSESHAIIVPTSRDFPEGFNRVSIEAVICGRPVIVSTAVIEPPISSAAIVIDPDDVGAYCDAIRKLVSDQSFYERKVQAASAMREQFFDPAFGWEAGLNSILAEQA
jgi:glycogen(starch) synthase